MKPVYEIANASNVYVYLLTKNIYSQQFHIIPHEFHFWHDFYGTSTCSSYTTSFLIHLQIAFIH